MATIKTEAKQQRIQCSLFFTALLLLVVVDYSRASPMMYKKNTQDKYEADLVPVSSTVIPLSVLEVSYGLGGKPSEEYKMAYLKKLRKKVLLADALQADQPSAEKLDTLITIKNSNNKADVKSI